MAEGPKRFDDVVAESADRPLSEEQQDEFFHRLDVAAEEIHRRAGTRAATPDEVAEFHGGNGPFDSDHEG